MPAEGAESDDDHDCEEEAETHLRTAARKAAAPPERPTAASPSASPRRKKPATGSCGTFGCTLPDYHLGLCNAPTKKLPSAQAASASQWAQLQQRSKKRAEQPAAAAVAATAGPRSAGGLELSLSTCNRISRELQAALNTRSVPVHLPLRTSTPYTPHTLHTLCTSAPLHPCTPSPL